MEEQSTGMTIDEVKADRASVEYHLSQASVGLELRVRCKDGEVVFAYDRVGRQAVLLTYRR